MAKYKMAIFDLDGTLLNTLSDIHLSLNYSLKKNKLKSCSISDTQKFIGNGIRKLIERATKSNSAEMIDNVYNDFTFYYKQHLSDTTTQYDGITDCLAKLKENGVLVTVLSNKDDYAVKQLCDKHFKGLIDFALGSNVNMRNKPFPDGVEYILSKYNIDKNNAVYIGDSDTDIMTAKNSGIDCISVLWGYRDESFLLNSGATKIVKNVQELISDILEN